MKQIRFLLILLSLSSCAARIENKTSYIDLTGKRLDIDSDISLFEIVYANDTMLVASLLSPTYKLAAYGIGGDKPAYEFLRVGRGPLEVSNISVKALRDTLRVLSYGPSNLRDIISIPVNGIRDMSTWNSVDMSGGRGVYVGNSFDPSTNVFLGGKFGDKAILSVISEEERTFESLTFWPEDGYMGDPLPKQGIYIRGSKVFGNGSKVFYACGEGRYFSILDMSSSPAKETVIYDECPRYEVSSDGLNPKRAPESGLGGIVFATDSLIYISPLDCHIVKHQYVPKDFKGYPPYYNDMIEVYDWDGEYQRTYKVDIPFGGFYVTGDCLYTLTTSQDTMLSEVYKYDLAE